MQTFDLVAHLKRQIAFSRATFGPGARTQGVIDHIRKELVEVEESGGNPQEWTDVVILALDGLTRSLVAENIENELEPSRIVDLAALVACEMVIDKQGRNEMRSWPDWRTADPNKAIEHDRSGE